MNQVAIVIPHVYSFQVTRFVSILTLQLGKYLVLFSIHDVVTHPLLTHGQLKCSGNILHGNPHTGSLVPININGQLRGTAILSATSLAYTIETFENPVQVIFFYSLSCVIVGEIIKFIVFHVVVYPDRDIVSRKAEVYYMAAECLNETGSVTDRQKAINYLNIVREKRGIQRKLGNDLSQSVVQKEILKEWRKEMLLEGQMFFYYKRRGVTNIQGSTVVMNDNTYVMPLPKTEVEFGGRETY